MTNSTHNIEPRIPNKTAVNITLQCIERVSYLDQMTSIPGIQVSSKSIMWSIILIDRSHKPINWCRKTDKIQHQFMIKISEN